MHGDLLSRLALSVCSMDEEATRAVAREVLTHKIDALTAMNEGLSAGMNEAGEYFVPELLLCSDAMVAGLEILRPHLPRESILGKAKVVIGVVRGDVHDIGKNLVALTCEVAGFEVCNLGKDVPPEAFVAKVREVNADLLCLSTMMSTTMDGMADVIELLTRTNLREKVVVIVGGGPVSRSFADCIGADGYAENAIRAARLAKELLLQR